MATLEMLEGPGTIGYELTPIKLLGLMLFPDDSITRTQWLTATAIAALHSAPTSPAGGIPPTSAEILQMISEAPASNELMMRGAEGAKHGTVAARILMLVLSLSAHAPEQATVRRAIRVVGMEAASNMNQRLPRNLTTLKEVWSRFKPVSHLWAAVQCKGSNENGGTGAGSDFLSAQNLPQFLAVAEWIRIRGISHRPPGGRTNSRAVGVSTLDPETAWKPPAHLKLPNVWVKMPPPPKRILEELRDYRADR